MKMLLGNKKTELKLARYSPTKSMMRGAEREAMLFMFKEADHSYEELKKLLSDDTLTKTMTVENSNTVEGYAQSETITTIENFIVPSEPMVQPAKEVLELEGTEEDVFIVMLGKLTFIEEQLVKMGIPITK